ncbi:vacuolar protein sorting-associated protein VTA1 homolog isoform X2 [Littorina saxatilis]|uniref:Vacuolar protein sorting-associated protein VTA1-like protein n=1 Tax=Littorina saxatilis TaxID=31220 RepID=A0AAN9BP73_9CAEN
MASFNVPLPHNLKPIQHYLKTAAEHEKRDIVVAYYCLLHALQRAMEIDKKSPEARTFLVALMDHLEKIKKEHDDEAIHNEVVGQAHMENYALKVFLYADNEDRASRFNKNVVKSFYTAGMLFDVLTNFGEPAEDIEKNRKYAKWKAAYIHKCLKNGETPLPGPLGEDGEEGFDPMPQMPQPGGSSYDQPGTSYSAPPPTSFSAPGPSSGLQPPGVHAPPTTPMDSPPVYEPPSLPKPAPRSSPQPPKHDFTAVANNNWEPAPNPAGVSLTSQHYQKAMKYCKYASSALQYEDSKTAIDNLQKALRLITTGSDS